MQLICQHLKERVLPNLPIEAGKDESDIRVGFVTYDKAVHFYNVKVCTIARAAKLMPMTMHII